MSRRQASDGYLHNRSIQEAEKKMKIDLEKLLQGCPNTERVKYQEELRGFLELFLRYLNSNNGNIIWKEIQDIPPKESLIPLHSFPKPPKDHVRNLLKKLVVIKLNGGLGTTLKCDGPKCLIPLRNALTFLDLTVQQIVSINNDYDADVPLIIMNSFKTDKITRETITKYIGLEIKIHTFMQERYPRINSINFTPLPQTFNDSDNNNWYPPGHGNFYKAFSDSGLLEMFLADGREFCFVSNSDNVGATIDLSILNALVNSSTNPSVDFLMEVTDKTQADIKGGTLIHFQGRPKLLEYSQVPKDHVDEFKFGGKFQMFNTNNIWMKLESIRQVTRENKLSLGIIDNRKTIEVHNGELVDIIQLETAIGAAIESFTNPIGVIVPRTRFLPVKNSSDLFLLRCNAYRVDMGRIFLNPERPFSTAPFIRLDDEHFKDYRDLDKRFEKMPDCLDLQSLKVSGDVTFGRDVSLKGNVAIIADIGGKIIIPHGSVLQDKLITGSLNIIDY